LAGSLQWVATKTHLSKVGSITLLRTQADVLQVTGNGEMTGGFRGGHGSVPRRSRSDFFQEEMAAPLTLIGVQEFEFARDFHRLRLAAVVRAHRLVEQLGRKPKQ
jgi:hypothetical protein